jgi:hypothetical protein
MLFVGKSMFVVRTMRNTRIQCVGRMQSFFNVKAGGTYRNHSASTCSCLCNALWAGPCLMSCEVGQTISKTDIRGYFTITDRAWSLRPGPRQMLHHYDREARRPWFWEPDENTSQRLLFGLPKDEGYCFKRANYWSRRQAARLTYRTLPKQCYCESPGSRARPVRRADNLGILNISQPYRAPWPVTGIALLFTFTY